MQLVPSAEQLLVHCLQPKGTSGGEEEVRAASLQAREGAKAWLAASTGGPEPGAQGGRDGLLKKGGSLYCRPRAQVRSTYLPTASRASLLGGGIRKQMEGVRDSFPAAFKTFHL